jgi:hypothetical protein
VGATAQSATTTSSQRLGAHASDNGIDASGTGARLDWPDGLAALLLEVVRLAEAPAVGRAPAVGERGAEIHRLLPPKDQEQRDADDQQERVNFMPGF